MVLEVQTTNDVAWQEEESMIFVLCRTIICRPRHALLRINCMCWLMQFVFVPTRWR